MKTGLIVSIKDGKAIIIQPGGRFITAPAKPEWAVGDLVPVPRQLTAYLRPLMSVACAAVISLVSIWGYRAYTTPALLVSLDVNPSIEFQTNRFNRIISSASYNQEGEALLDQSRIRNQTLEKGVESLFDHGLERYLEDSPYITVAVQSDSDARERAALRELQAIVGGLPAVQGGADVSVDYLTADAQQVQSAHGHHITAGKYLTLLQLQQMAPQTQLDEYSACGIGEIKQEIARCHGQMAPGAAQDGNPTGGKTPSQGANHDGEAQPSDGAGTTQPPESAPAPRGGGCRGRHGGH